MSEQWFERQPAQRGRSGPDVVGPEGVAVRLDRGAQPHISTVPLEALLAAQQETAAVRVELALFRYIVTLVARTRNSTAVSLGASPRAAIGFLLHAAGLEGAHDINRAGFDSQMETHGLGVEQVHQHRG